MSLMLKNVRLSFAALATIAPARAMPDGKMTKPKWGAALLIPKTDTATIAEINKHVQMCADEAAGKPVKIRADKHPLKDGDEYEYDGYDGHMFIKASSTEDHKPLLVTGDRVECPQDMAATLFRSGNYVNAKIGFWWCSIADSNTVQTNGLAFQFVKTGDSFGAAAETVEDSGFEVVEGATANDFDEEIPF